MRSQQDVFNEIERRALTLREQTNYALTKEQAISKIAEEHPDLYREYRAAPFVPEVKKQEPASITTVKQELEKMLLRLADEIQRREKCDRMDAICKAAATPSGRLLYDAIRDSRYASMPVEELISRKAA